MLLLLLLLVQQQRRIKGCLHARIVTSHGILRKIIIVRVRVEQVRIIRVLMSPRLIQLILKRRRKRRSELIVLRREAIVLLLGGGSGS
jgi:hypothetical protein